MNENQGGLVLQKSVKVMSTVGRSGVSYTTSATTWGQLCGEIRDNFSNASGMKAMIGETQLGLETPESQLPDGDFTLFLFPHATKSGAVSIERQKISAYIEQYGDVAKNFFNSGDKNYTRKTKDEHVKLVKGWEKKIESGKVKPVHGKVGGISVSQKKEKPAPSQEVKEKLGSLVGGLKGAAAEAAKDVVSGNDQQEKAEEILLTDNDRITAAFLLIQELTDRRIPGFNKDQCLIQMGSIASRLGVKLPDYEASTSLSSWARDIGRNVHGIKNY